MGLNENDMEEIKTKVCTKCGEEKPETTEYFHRDKNGRCGLLAICKECRHKANRRWRAENPEKERERVRRWQAEKHEKVRERAKRWQAENPEKVREARKRRVDTLAPTYLKILIANKYDIHYSEIGDELIEAKQREITYYRQLKQLKK